MKHVSVCLTQRDIQVCTKYSATSLVFHCSNMKMKQNKSTINQIYPQIAKLYKKASKLILKSSLLNVYMSETFKYMSFKKRYSSVY